MSEAMSPLTELKVVLRTVMCMLQYRYAVSLTHRRTINIQLPCMSTEDTLKKTIRLAVTNEADNTLRNNFFALLTSKQLICTQLNASMKVRIPRKSIS